MILVSKKSRAGALVLAWLLGLFGAHRFYVNKTGTAVVIMALSFTIVGLAITGIWVLVDIVMIACGTFQDREGNYLKNW